MRILSSFDRFVRPVRNEDGAALVFFALIVLTLLGIFALAVDVGSAMNARSEAQRTADAAALAGAGLFQKYGGSKTPAQIDPLARDTALHFATVNHVGVAQISEPDVDVQVWPDERRVGVEIRGEAPLYFARFLGVRNLPVRAYAEARVMGAAAASCVKPLAIPDLWQSGATTSPVYNFPEYSAWDGGFNPARGDRYKPWDGTLTDFDATGFGAPVRNDVSNWQGNRYQHDNGRKVIIKTGSHAHGPNDTEVPTFPLNASDHFLLDMNSDRTPIPGVDCNSGSPVERNICQCNNTPIPIGGQVQKEPGNMSSTIRGMRKLIDADPTLRWDNVTQRVVDAHGNHVTESPRLIKVVLYDPTTASTDPNGMLDVVNVGLIFLEGFDGNGNNRNALGRFIQFASGSGAGTGTTTLSLQLVK